jgi:hypothetical protein
MANWRSEWERSPRVDPVLFISFLRRGKQTDLGDGGHSGRLWFSFLERGKEGRRPDQGRARRIWICPRWLCLGLNSTGGLYYIRCGLAAARGLVAGPSAIATSYRCSTAASNALVDGRRCRCTAETRRRRRIIETTHHPMALIAFAKWCLVCVLMLQVCCKLHERHQPTDATFGYCKTDFYSMVKES